MTLLNIEVLELMHLMPSAIPIWRPLQRYGEAQAAWNALSVISEQSSTETSNEHFEFVWEGGARIFDRETEMYESADPSSLPASF